MTERIMPIRPEEVVEQRRQDIPDAVFEVFNDFIAKSMRGNVAIVYQEDVVNNLEKCGYDEKEIYHEKWLDVEPIYREAGWQVVYDKPMAYAGETYRANFKFTVNK